MTMTTTKEANEPVLKQEYAGVKLVMESYIFPEEKLQTTPSELDGLSKEAEEDLRLLGCEYIQIAGIMLHVPQVAMATAQVLFQRFYFIKSFVKNKMEEVAMACIWLASKVEEAPRRLRDVLNVFYYFKQKLKNVKEPVSMPLDTSYISLKNNVIKAERRLLKELGFCVHIKHPHKIIVMYLQVLEMQGNKDLVQTAWNYMNDSLRTVIFVKYSTETIACACIYLAARILQVPLPNQPHWFYLFGATEEEIQEICITLMRVYQHKKQPYSILEAEVEKCQKVLEEKKLKAREALGLATNVQSANNSPAATTTSPFADPTLNPSPKKEPVVVPDKQPSKTRNSNQREEHGSEERERRRNEERSRHHKRSDKDKYDRRHHSKHSRKHHRHRDESGKRSRSSLSPEYKKPRKTHSSRSSSNR